MEVVGGEGSGRVPGVLHLFSTGKAVVNLGEGKQRELQWGNVLHGNAFQGKELSSPGEKKVF